MKRLIAGMIISLLMGPVFAEEAPASTSAPAAVSTAPATTNTASTEAKQDEGKDSSGFTDSVRTYWNKFIDVFTGPPTKN